MTTTLSFIDNALGIHTSTSADPDLANTMKEFAQFHPTQHAELIKSLDGGRAIRDLVTTVANVSIVTSETSTPAYELVDAYNDAVTSVTELRYAHIDHIGTYIFSVLPTWVQLQMVTGTGNTPIAKYLCNAAAGTLEAQVPPIRFRGSISVPTVCHAQCALDSMDNRKVPTLCDDAQSLFRRMRLSPSYNLLPEIHGPPATTVTGGTGKKGTCTTAADKEEL